MNCSVDHFISYNFTMGATGNEGFVAQQRELLVDAGSCRPTPLLEATLLFLLKKKYNKVCLVFCYYFFAFIFIASPESYFHYFTTIINN
jgi:hypothetical protein